VAPFDINSNGIIDIEDLLDILSTRPQVEEFGLYEKE
jgi:Ca2+-binding EF-hand superfamily protein